MNKVRLHEEQDVKSKLGSFSVELCAILGLRASIRALPLLAAYSDGINKSHFPIPAFGFWAEVDRPIFIKELFLSHRQLLTLSSAPHRPFPNLRSDSSVAYLAVESANKAYQQSRSDGISFSSIERKNAFYSIYRLVCRVLDFTLSPYEYGDRNLIFLGERINECAEELRKMKADVRSLLVGLEKVICCIDVKSIASSRRNTCLAKAIVFSDNMSRRLESFAVMTSSLVKTKHIKALNEFSEQAARVGDVYRKISAASSAGEFDIACDLLKRLVVDMECYEAARINMMPHDAELNVDFFIEFPQELANACWNFADEEYLNYLSSELDRLKKSARAVVSDIDNDIETRALSLSFDCFLDCWSEVNQLEIEVSGDSYSYGKCFDSLSYLLRTILDLNESSVMQSSLLHEDMRTWVGVWFNRIIESMNESALEYTSFPTIKYAKIFTIQLEEDIDFCVNGDAFDILCQPIWSSDFDESIHEWNGLWDTFWGNAVALNDELKVWMHKYQAAIQNGVVELQ